MRSPRLEYLPVALFGSVMGLCGLAVAWRLASMHYALPMSISVMIGAIAVVAFLTMAIGYAVKFVDSPHVVRAEFNHPVAGNLFGTAFISLLLLPIVVAPYQLAVARTLWTVGACAMLVFAWAIVKRWLTDRHAVEHATPAWIVPAVGLLDVPLAVPFLQMPPLHGLMILALAVGLFFAVTLFTLIFSRLVFEPPLPDPLQPTLMILLAPFAVGVSAYVATVGHVDVFAQCLFGLTLFILCVLGGRLRHLGRCCPFRTSWWAISFPLAAAAIAALRMAIEYPDWTTETVAVSLLSVATFVVGWLLARTLIGIAQGELRTLSG